MEKILLGYASVGDGEVGEAAGIVNAEHLFDPGVDGKGLPPIETEEQCTFRHFWSNAPYGLEDFSGLVDGHGGDGR